MGTATRDGFVSTVMPWTAGLDTTWWMQLTRLSQGHPVTSQSRAHFCFRPVQHLVQGRVLEGARGFVQERKGQEWLVH